MTPGYMWGGSVVAVMAVIVITGFIMRDMWNRDTAEANLATTEDIGWRVESNVELKSASFRPVLTEAAAIAKAQTYMGDGFSLPDPELLSVRVTVATYTGEQEGPK